jgi:hypothetical protein
VKYNKIIVAAYFKECGLPKPGFEIKYIPGRKFSLDVGWPEYKVGIEVQGSIWMKSGHSSAAGIRRDMEKNKLGLLNGWRVIAVEPANLCMQETVDTIIVLIELAKGKL